MFRAFRVWGFGFGVWRECLGRRIDSGVRVQGFGLREEGLGMFVPGAGLRLEG